MVQADRYEGAKATESTPQGTAPLRPIPADLREWIDEERLLDLALEVVAELDLPARGLASFPDQDRQHRAPMLCTLLTFCYATGRLASEEIEAGAYRDRTLAYLVAKQVPAWNTLRRFRRVYHSFLSRSLARLIEQAWTHRPGADQSTPSARERSALQALFVLTAEERLQLAALADTVAMDV